MFINLSNHPSDKWPKNQIEAAKPYGALLDLAFPDIDPSLDLQQIVSLASTFANKITRIAAEKPLEPCVVHLMGELTFCFALAQRLQWVGIVCIASTTRRQVFELQNGMKASRFSFVRFREYAVASNN